MRNILQAIKNKLRYFRVRKYEHLDYMDLIAFIFLWSAIGIIVFIYGAICYSFYGVSVIAEQYLTAGSVMILSVLPLCGFFPFRSAALLLVCFVFFVVVYIHFIAFLVRLFFHLGWG